MRVRRSHWVFAGVTLVLLALQGLHATDLADIAYRRSNIEVGEWWRVVTGHWVHNNTHHFLLNITALALCYAIAAQFSLVVRSLAILALVTPVLGGALFLFEPELEYYVGLSGVLHGLVVAMGILLVVKGEMLVGSLLLVLVAAKIVSEANGLVDLSGIEQAIGIKVWARAHELGGKVGVFVGLMMLLAYAGFVRLENRR